MLETLSCDLNCTVLNQLPNLSKCSVLETMSKENSGSVSEHDSDSETEGPQSMVAGVESTQATDGVSKPSDRLWQQNLQVDADGAYFYTNAKTGIKYRWAEDQQCWMEQNVPSTEDSGDIVQSLKQQAHNQGNLQPWEEYLRDHEEGEEYTYTDPTDGTVFFWDEGKRAWFPKIDEDFLAAYQANYGTSTEETTENKKEEKDQEIQAPVQKHEEKTEVKVNDDKDSKKRKADDKGWFDVDPDHNHNVYVSGLPPDFTDEDFFELMSKCGIIMEHPDTQKQKCKLYRDHKGNVKGDGLCCYLRSESVTLALQLLDDTNVQGHKIKVEKAVFQLKGEYDPTKKPKKKKKKKKGGQEKLLDWVDRDRKRSKFDRIVILKSMFNPSEFENNPSAVNEIRDDIKAECSKFGEVRKVLVFDRNPEGICSVCFAEPENADSCIEALNGRWFGGKRISVERYDGVTRYQAQETEEELEARLKQWEQFLEEDNEEGKPKTS